MKGNRLIGSILVVGVLLSFSVEAGEKKQPNILFVVSDDLYRDQYGFLGGNALTPTFDRLASEGIYFENGYVSSSASSPSRYSSLSGHYTSRCQLEWFTRGNTAEGVTRILWHAGFSAGQLNVPRVLKEAGYSTGFTGKWHLNGMRHLIQSIQAGADPYNPDIQKIMRNNQRLICEEIKQYGFDFVEAVYSENPSDDPTLKATGCDVHNQEWHTQAALRFIDTHKDGPWFLCFAPTLMHSPNPFASLTGDPRKSGMGVLDRPITGVQPSRESVIERTKAAGIPEKNRAVTWLDDGLASVLAKVQEHGLEKNTLIIYINDNGMESHSKGTCYQGGIRTQIMAYWPGVIEPGLRPRELVQNVDFAPTFFELAGIDPPKEMVLDGRSLVPLFRGESPEDWRTVVYSEIGLTRAVCSTDWSYVAFYVPPSLQRTKKERVAEARQYYYGDMLKQHPWMEGVYPFLEEAPYFQLGMKPGGLAYERWQLKSAEESPWAASYFDQDQLFDLRTDPKETRNLATLPAYQGQLELMKQELSRFLKRLPGPYPGLMEEALHPVEGR
jgi:arylsulfatase A-like enzyme